MDKFYIIEWPEAQKWSDMWHEDNSLNIRLLDGQAVAVECSLYEKKVIARRKQMWQEIDHERLLLFWSSEKQQYAVSGLNEGDPFIPLFGGSDLRKDLIAKHQAKGYELITIQNIETLL